MSSIWRSVSVTDKIVRFFTERTIDEGSRECPQLHSSHRPRSHTSMSNWRHYANTPYRWQLVALDKHNRHREDTNGRV